MASMRDIQRRKETIINERSALNYAKKEGKEEKTIELIKNMLENNLDMNTICAITKLSETEINNLLNK